ncbi:hypothetical protein O6H91_19G048400 [Diphasiastrum complanatum]|uniref:Uncharacterized protein n=1 Tax=Diphasiastrum complanatum TaxID=34168 RepID=A0ACC2AUZ1_DIPCM|nr:hypothetical protein O6H91_19G048400 [Diphasiastrum complanatum]
MDEDFQSNLESDLVGTVVKPPSIRVSRSFRGASFNRSTPQGSPSFRRLSSIRTPRKEPQVNVSYGSWFSRYSPRRLIPWMILLGLWSYVGYYVLSKRASVAESDGQDVLRRVLPNTFSNAHKRDSISSANTAMGKRLGTEISLQNSDRDSLLSQPSPSLKNWATSLLWPGSVGKGGRQANGGTGNATGIWNEHSSKQYRPQAERNRVEVPVRKVDQYADQAYIQSVKNVMDILEGVDLRLLDANKTSKTIENQNGPIKDESHTRVPTVSTSSKLVGPFDDLENEILQLRKLAKPNKCTHEGSFLRAVKEKYVVVVIHELSMTGAPLAMIELASEVLSCGGKVAAVLLSRKGGLLSELSLRRIPVIKDKAIQSWKEAAKADLVVAGSAVCAGWIDSFVSFKKEGANRVIWWLMENRREYFDRSKNVLGLVKAVIFLSEIQFQQWHQWCKLEDLTLPSEVSVIALSINDDIVAAAGLRDAFEGQIGGYADFHIKRKRLCYEVRKAMGVEPNDILFVSLSSINPGKGQLLMLEAASLVGEGHRHSLQGQVSSEEATDIGDEINRHESVQRKALARNLSYSDVLVEFGNESSSPSARTKQGRQLFANSQNEEFSIIDRKEQASVESCQNQSGNCSMKILIGSVNSKSNKVDYVQKILIFLEEHTELATATLLTPASVHIAALYSAADVYIINAQGIGETFGRVTIEAMAFGLPVLGTDAGGTREIVIANVTGLLHPVGKLGVPLLAKHMDFLLKNPHIGREMGQRGKERVQNMYTKSIMYEKLAIVFLNSLK